VVYRALLGTRPASEQAFCEGCHSRGGTGLSCTDCHAAVGNETTSNGLLRFGDPSVVGTTRAVVAPHQLEVRPFLSSSDLCGTCHEVHGPAFFVETPFTEWSAGAKVKTCAQCHLEASSHALSGIHDGASALLDGAVSLALVPVGAEVELRLTSNVQGHAFPSGSTFARRLEVTVPGALVVNFDERPLEAAETRTWRFTPQARCVRATVTFWRYRPELLASLNVVVENAPRTLTVASLGCEAEVEQSSAAP
jgi:Zn-finger protein